MAPLLYCLVLFYQIVSAIANQCIVAYCDSAHCSGNICTQCFDAFFSFAPSECRQCSLACRDCGGICYRSVHESCNDAYVYQNCTCSQKNTIECLSCPDGFYKQGSLCNRCFNTGCTCYNPNDCNECLPGRHGDTCQDTCPIDCVTCTSNNSCSRCVTGKYGPVCELDCALQCNHVGCDKDTGTCLNGCPTNQYLDSKNKCHNCEIRCSSCIDYEHCTSCKQTYYWGPVCQEDCVGCYTNCKKDTGCELGCEGGYYRTYYEDLNGYACASCPDTCATCNNASDCNSCVSNHWGSTCQHQCSGCSQSCQQKNGCTVECVAGYYKQAINGGQQCQKCMIDNCSVCLSESICNECDTGYYLSDDAECITCSYNCIDKECSRNNGTCVKSCKQGWSGHRCNESCPANCLECEQFSSMTCTNCAIGYYGDSCQYECSIHCKHVKDTQICYKGNGTCIYGCQSGHWESTCTHSCQRGCNGSSCNAATGVCSHGCIISHYGKRCEHECSSNCLKQSEITHHCNAENGSCQMGCNNGWHGENCTHECNNCKSLVCFQQNGTCVYGCTEGFTGLKCADRTGGNINNAALVAVSVVAGIAVFLAVVVVGGVVILLKRGQLVFIRNKGNASSSECQNQELDNSAYQDLNRTESADGTYSTVQTDYENSL